MDSWTIAAALAALVLFLVNQQTGAAVAAGLFDDMADFPATNYTPDYAPRPSGLFPLAQAIARAEGFGRFGAIPTRAHNPGDLAPRDWAGDRLGSAGIAVYATDDDGWAALYRQLGLIASQRSRVYGLDDTIATMAAKWTGGDNAETWAANVAAMLNANGFPVTVDSLLGEVLA